jgi:hypothetical protein
VLKTPANESAPVLLAVPVLPVQQKAAKAAVRELAGLPPGELAVLVRRITKGQYSPKDKRWEELQALAVFQES